MTDRNRPDRNGDAEKNIALLIDADNASPDHLDSFRSWLRSGIFLIAEPPSSYDGWRGGSAGPAR